MKKIIIVCLLGILLFGCLGEEKEISDGIDKTKPYYCFEFTEINGKTVCGDFSYGSFHVAGENINLDYDENELMNYCQNIIGVGRTLYSKKESIRLIEDKIFCSYNGTITKLTIPNTYHAMYGDFYATEIFELLTISVMKNRYYNLTDGLREQLKQIYISEINTTNINLGCLKYENVLISEDIFEQIDGFEYPHSRIKLKPKLITLTGGFCAYQDYRKIQIDSKKGTLNCLLLQNGEIDCLNEVEETSITTTVKEEPPKTNPCNISMTNPRVTFYTEVNSGDFNFTLAYKLYQKTDRYGLNDLIYKIGTTEVLFKRLGEEPNECTFVFGR